MGLYLVIVAIAMFALGFIISAGISNKKVVEAEDARNSATVQAENEMVERLKERKYFMTKLEEQEVTITLLTSELEAAENFIEEEEEDTAVRDMPELLLPFKETGVEGILHEETVYTMATTTPAKLKKIKEAGTVVKLYYR